MRRLHETLTNLQSTLQSGGATLTANRTSVLQTVTQLQQQAGRSAPPTAVCR